MGKQGPCYHCGVTSTPLWRNGPPEKPVLCNACGSRWRTKGTLANYTPLHARAEPDDEERRVCRVKSISINKKKDPKVLKRKQNYVYGMVGGDIPDDNHGYLKAFDEDTSNRSSSGSAISNSESCAQVGSGDASELTGPAQSVVWDTIVPSKKRTCVNRPKPTSIEKLTKDLYTILHEQQQSSCISESTEEDILIEIETPMASAEMGHGSVLIRHPGSLVRDEESEASSLSVDNQYYLSEAYSHSGILAAHKVDKDMKLQSFKSDDGRNYAGTQMQGELPKRDKTVLESLEMLGCHDSALRYVDLQDVVNFEEFKKNLSNEEQEQLFAYLPDVDTAKLSESLKTMFDSPQFKENLSSFQKLLAEGVFDISLAGVKREYCQTLKRLALLNLTKSSWVERYCTLKKRRSITRGPHLTKVPNVTADSSVNVKRPRDDQNQKISDSRTMTKSSKRVMIDTADCEGSCFSPRNLFALPSDGKGLPLIDESSDQDLLLEVPSNGSFLQAELLPSNYRF